LLWQDMGHRAVTLAGFCPETTQEAFACTGTLGGEMCRKLRRTKTVAPPGSSLIVYQSEEAGPFTANMI
jgi:hypothetical protein